MAYHSRNEAIAASHSASVPSSAAASIVAIVPDLVPALSDQDFNLDVLSDTET